MVYAPKLDVTLVGVKPILNALAPTMGSYLEIRNVSGPWSPTKYGKMPLDERVKHYYNNKFVRSTVKGTGELKNRCAEDAAARILRSGNYDQWLALGVLHRKDAEGQLKQEFGNYGVKVFFIRDILREIKFKGTGKSPTGRFIQLLASQLTDDARASLFKRTRRKTRN